MTADEAGFAEVLLHPGTPTGLTSWNGSDPGQRFGVYRNNVLVSLIEALRVRFPVVEALVGADFFAEMAKTYALDMPPASRLMKDYGATFPKYIAGYAPADTVPYLSDVARLECARTIAYHAADAPALGIADLAAIARDRLADLHLTLHPSVAVIESRFAIVSLWAAHQGVLDISGVDPFQPEDALVLRPQAVVEVRQLPPGAAAALHALRAGANVGDALAETSSIPGADPVVLFQSLITFGAVSAAVLP